MIEIEKGIKLGRGWFIALVSDLWLENLATLTTGNYHSIQAIVVLVWFGLEAAAVYPRRR